MGLRKEIEDILQIQDAKEKIRKIEDVEDGFRDSGSLETDEVGEIAAILLNFALGEANDDMKEAIFSLLLTAASWRRIDKYIDWNGVISQISHLTGYSLLYTLELLGWSREKKYISFLEECLNYPDVRVKITALEAISQIWWDMSDKSDEAKEKMKIKEIGHIWQLLYNPQKHHISDAEIERQLLPIKREFIANMRDWFEIYGSN